MDNITQAQNL